MEQIKAVGKAIRNSPRAIRKKLGHDQGHEKLAEDWYHSDDPIISGVTFYVKYLGSTEVKRTHGPGSTDDAVKSIVHDAKHRGGKLQKVQMTVSSKFMKLVDVAQQMKLDEIPLYRVSYCTVDPYYDKVFCYIARNHETKHLECHAFLCSKKSKAEAITLTVAQAFNIAYEKWQESELGADRARRLARSRMQRYRRNATEEAHKKKKESGKQSGGSGGVTNGQIQQASGGTEEVDIGIGDLLSSPPQPLPPTQPEQKQPSPEPLKPSPEPLQPSPQPSPLPPQGSTDTAAEGISGMSIGVTPASPSYTQPKESSNPFASMEEPQLRNPALLRVKSTIPKAVSLDYLQLEDDFDKEFTRLAEARSNPHLLAIGDHMNREEMKDDTVEMMRGEKNADDLGRSKSIDDLLML